jgi:thymidylate kinase
MQPIINVRGTSGSGKSTIVRNIMALYRQKTAIKIKGRKQPIGYLLQRLDRSLFVPGHYETACGGCDTITKMDDVMSYVAKAADDGHAVLFEGVLLSAEVNRFVALTQAGYPVRTFYLSTPIEVCISSINERRKAKKEDAPPVDPRITTNRLRSIASGRKRLDAAGVPSFEGSREELFEMIRTELGV